MADILYEKSDVRARITLNRPHGKNALSQAMWAELESCVRRADEDGAVRLIVFSGSGGAFSAGADISEFPEVYSTPEKARASNEQIAAALSAVDRLNTPSMAVIEGVCMGGGCALALACDLQVCATDAIFGINPTALGTAYRYRDCQRIVNRVGMARARQFLIGGAQINADVALSWGLISEVAPGDKLMRRVEALAADIESRSPDALRRVKMLLREIDRGAGEPDELMDVFSGSFESADFREGVSAFLEKRKPNFTGG